jgi:Rrf2 family protein
MSSNSRFAVATHILVLMAIENKEEPTTSEYLARSACTNPVVIRRILGSLHKAGFVTAQPGAGGGTHLARHPEDITLFEVYHAVGDVELFSLGSRKPNPDCICGRNIQPILTDVFCRAEMAVEKSLAGITVAQIARQVEERDAYPLPLNAT